MNDAAPQLPIPTLVTDPDQLQQLVERWQHEPALACDTESNSLYAYRERLCLFQLSTPTADYLIDPLAVSLEPLRPLLADPAIEKIFHAAEYDIFLLKREFQFEVINLFDTMIAARVIGREKIGLAALLEEFFGLHADKRFQRADWSQRPLPADQLYYAQQDTHYLFTVRDKLYAELEAADRLTEARELFALQSETQPPDLSFDPEGFWRLNGTRGMNPRQLARLRALYMWRDGVAQKANVPPFKIMGDSVLIDLALLNPQASDNMSRIHGLTPGLVRRYGTDLLQAITHGNHAPLPHFPEPPVIDPLVRARFDALHEWRKQTASARGVASDIVLSKESMWSLATDPPKTPADWLAVPGFNDWRRDRYAESLGQALTEAEAAFYAESSPEPESGPEES